MVSRTRIRIGAVEGSPVVDQITFGCEADRLWLRPVKFAISTGHPGGKGQATGLVHVQMPVDGLTLDVGHSPFTGGKLDVHANEATLKALNWADVKLAVAAPHPVEEEDLPDDEDDTDDTDTAAAADTETDEEAADEEAEGEVEDTAAEDEGEDEAAEDSDEEVADDESAEEAGEEEDGDALSLGQEADAEKARNVRGPNIKHILQLAKDHGLRPEKFKTYVALEDAILEKIAESEGDAEEDETPADKKPAGKKKK